MYARVTFSVCLNDRHWH